MPDRVWQRGAMGVPYPDIVVRHLSSVMAARSAKWSATTAISDDLWSKVEPLLPPRTRATNHPFRRRPGAGRKPIPARKAFEAIIHVLRTGTPWKSLPREFGSASAIHRRFDAWHAAGVFFRIWRAGLAEHEELEGISWRWRLRDEPGRGSATAGSASSAGAMLPVSLIKPRIWQPSRVRRQRQRLYTNWPPASLI
jgi:transposase